MPGTVTPVDAMDDTLGSQPQAERIYDNVTLVVPGVTLPLIKVNLWNTVEEFALRSTMFRAEVFWSMAIGVSTVDFNPFSADMSACWVLSQHGLWHWRVDPPAQLRDLTAPNNVRTGKVILALKPLSFDANLPAEMFSTWFEALLDGTLFRLYGTPSKPWSDVKLATYHGTRFRQSINRARDLAARNWSPQQPRWFFPLFAAGRRKQ